MTTMRTNVTASTETELGELILSLALFGGRLDDTAPITYEGTGVWKVRVFVPETHFEAFKAHRTRIADTHGKKRAFA